MSEPIFTPLTLEELNLAPVGHPITIELLKIQLGNIVPVGTLVTDAHLEDLAFWIDRYSKQVIVNAINTYFHNLYKK